jgi:hypothetical protein
VTYFSLFSDAKKFFESLKPDLKHLKVLLKFFIFQVLFLAADIGTDIKTGIVWYGEVR